MKTINSLCSLHHRIILCSLVAFFIIHTGLAQQLPLNYQLKHEEASTYQQGVINIKVKEGIGPYAKQIGQVSFNIESLDRLVEEFEISVLAKRFTHKPIPKDSGLPDISRIYKVEFSEEVDIWEVSAAFSADQNIEYAEPIPVHRATIIPDDPMYVSQQHLPQIMAEEAWDIHKGEDGSSDIVVAIVDSGVDWLHPDLTQNAWQNLGEDADGDGVTREFNNGTWELDPDDLNGIDDDGNGYTDDLMGWDFWESNNGGNGSNPDPYPHFDAHGTHCAGIAAGVTNNGIGISSISYNIQYMPAKIDNGNNSFLYAMDGMIYAAESGADIISNSWGGGPYSQVDKEIVDYATGLGSIVVAAAGNGNTSELHYPSSYPGVVSVAAVNADDTRANFSHYGLAIDVSAPGVGILSTITNSNYASWNGTSMATPMVAGLMGLVKSYNPDWSNDEILIQVMGTADDISSLNPGYENYLGSGRINAFQALDDDGVTVPEVLKLDLIGFDLEDGNGNGMLEPGDEATISAAFRNFSHLVGDDDVTFTLSTFDPDVTITNASYTIDVAPDSEFELEDAFVFEVNEDAEQHIATFFIEVTTDMQLIQMEEFQMGFVVAPSGFYVWDGELNDITYSGEFIAQFLEEQGHDVIYSDVYPHSFAGFDGVFLSFGNGGENADQATIFEYEHSETIEDYLNDGGNLYMEGMALLGISDYFSFPNAANLKSLFGVASVTFDFVSNPISSLEGEPGSIGEDMLFTESTQIYNWYIDKLTPAATATIPFYEEGYGNVSISNDGSFGQKTFYLGYTLADLVDVDPVSSRYNLMARIMDHFGYPLGDDFVVANFVTDETEVLPGDEIMFTDWSISDEGYPVDSWAWDFDEDGEIDSDDQNPTWTYSSGGNYDVMLVASNGMSTDTLLRKNLVLVRSGSLVYESEVNGIDQSGTFIHDYMEDKGYDVIYTNHMPESLIGFDAVFASYGSAFFSSPELDDATANAIKSYLYQGGRMYLEGSQAMGNDQAGNNTFWFGFGIESVNNGTTNGIDMLAGQNESIMTGMEFSSSSQQDVNSIDIYEPYVTETAIVAFEESDYGAVAVQFDGTDFYGQKTFCMSYTLASLEDGSSPNTREELLQRILEFFNPSVGVELNADLANSQVRVYPNPAKNYLMLEFDADQKSVATIEIFDMWGQRVTAQQTTSPGKVTLDIGHLTPGTYFYKVSAGTLLQTDKVVITR